LNNNWLGKASDALTATPRSFAASVATLGRGYLSWSRIATGGHTVVHDEKGFSVAVPPGWEPSTDETGSGSFYRRPGDRSALLQVFRITESSAMGSCTLLQISSDQLKANPGYRQVSLEPTAGTGCELVYEYDSSESNGRRRGMERIVTTPDGGRWALLAAGPAADAATTRANLTAALESFRPD
ncbi:hypothetical protein EF912_31795, partial [Streptomyces sp. WAC07061]|uniref:hypothetical protein n=1 Tax=Streptomyces sp. WAC07061 TaxID=2487410 RepID=UPI000F7BA81E